jgi:hypothetical protein
MKLETIARATSFAIRVMTAIYDNDGWVHSWGRCSERNNDVGGAGDSCHLDYCAVDAGFYNEKQRDYAYVRCYDLGLHGYKYTFETEGYDRDGEKIAKTAYAFHMQDRPGEVPGG